MRERPAVCRCFAQGRDACQLSFLMETICSVCIASCAQQVCTARRTATARGRLGHLISPDLAAAHMLQLRPALHKVKHCLTCDAAQSLHAAAFQCIARHLSRCLPVFRACCGCSSLWRCWEATGRPIPWRHAAPRRTCRRSHSLPPHPCLPHPQQIPLPGAALTRVSGICKDT